MPYPIQSEPTDALQAAKARRAGWKVDYPKPPCDRCGLAAQDTPEGFLALHGSRLVCADCDSDLNNEECEGNPAAHPLNVFAPPRSA